MSSKLAVLIQVLCYLSLCSACSAAEKQAFTPAERQSIHGLSSAEETFFKSLDDRSRRIFLALDPAGRTKMIDAEHRRAERSGWSMKEQDWYVPSHSEGEMYEGTRVWIASSRSGSR